MNLSGKIVIITGAAGLLGRAFCMDVAQAQGTVILADTNEKEGLKLERQINQKFDSEPAVFKNVDITNSGSVKKLITSVMRRFGKIDALVNNAYPRSKNFGRGFEKVTFEDFCDNVNMHLGGYFLMTQQVAKVMVKQNFGNIINMASIYGFAAPRFEIYEGTDMTVPIEYAAIKGAVIILTKYLASYLGGHNIRVNCVSPGGVFNNQSKKFVKNYSRKVLLGKKMAQANDITGALVFLLGDGSKYITGQNFVVDAGWTV